MNKNICPAKVTFVGLESCRNVVYHKAKDTLEQTMSYSAPIKVGYDFM